MSRWEYYHHKHTHVWVNGPEREEWAELLKPSEEKMWEEEEGHWPKTKAEENHLALNRGQEPVSCYPEVLTGWICSFLGEILLSDRFFGFQLSSDWGTGWILPWSCPPSPAPVSLRELSPPFWWEKRNESWLGGRLEDMERNNSRCRRW